MSSYEPWEIAQGIPEQHAYEESRRRYQQRQDVGELEQSGNDFDQEVLLHGSTGERAYSFPPSRNAEEPKPEPLPIRAMRYAGKTKPSYG